jgi:Protein of unknown function (DUF3908)
MKQLISLEDLRKHSLQQSYSKESLDVFWEILLESGILKTVLDKTDYYLYPKYLWQENKKIELFFITKFELIMCTYNDEGNIMIESLFLKDISQININNLDTSNNIELCLIFANGREITLNSNDSNESWKSKYYQAIINVYSYLTKNQRSL